MWPFITTIMIISQKINLSSYTCTIVLIFCLCHCQKTSSIKMTTVCSQVCVPPLAGITGDSYLNFSGNNGREPRTFQDRQYVNLGEPARAWDQWMCQWQSHPCSPFCGQQHGTPALCLSSSWVSSRSRKGFLITDPVCSAFTSLLEKCKVSCGSKEHLYSPNPMALAFSPHRYHETHTTSVHEVSSQKACIISKHVGVEKQKIKISCRKGGEAVQKIN